MNLPENVTKQMILDVIDWALEDISKEQKNAQAEYEKDNSNEFQGALATAFQLAEEMIRNRLETLQD